MQSSYLKDKYGVDIVEYERLYEKQKGVCAICKKPETALSSKNNFVKCLAVDHCHKTKKIRGLICMSCNCILGHAKDDIQIFKQAITYLKSNG